MIINTPENAARDKHNRERNERRRLKRHKISKKWCEGCNTNFTTLLARQKYCSARCRERIEIKNRLQRTADKVYSAGPFALTLYPKYGWGHCAYKLCIKTFPRFSEHIKFCSHQCRLKDNRDTKRAARAVIVELDTDHREYVRDPD